MDVHAVHAIAFADLDGSADFGEIIVKGFQIQFFGGAEIDNDFVVLSGFNLFRSLVERHG